VLLRPLGRANRDINEYRWRGNKIESLGSSVRRIAGLPWLLCRFQISAIQGFANDSLLANAPMLATAKNVGRPPKTLRRIELNSVPNSSESYAMADTHLAPPPMVNLSSIGRAIHSDWRIVVAFMVFGGGLALIRDMVTPPTYRAVAILAVVNGNTGASEGSAGNLGALASLAGVSLSGTESRRAEYLAVLQSRRILSKFIRLENLMPVLFSNRWDSKSNAWRSSSLRRPPTETDVEEYFRNEILTVTDDKKTGLISVRIDWRDPVLAAKWANGIVALLNEEMRQTAVDEGRRSIEYLNQELAKTTVSEIRQSISRLLESRLNKIMVANTQDQYALRTVDPALPADPARPIKPRRVLDVVAGIFLGFSLGSGVAMWRKRRLWQPA
jgi:uncharacterized protein involved in exopolysaccharide biosynthesis